MDTNPNAGPDELLAQIVGEIAKALGERDNEARHQQQVRAQTAADTIMAFQPGDAIEAMLAGHCVMFHGLIVGSLSAAARGDEAARRGTRGNIVAMDKAFGNNLDRLERYRTNHAKPAAQPDAVHAETEISDRVRRHQARTRPAQPTVAPAEPAVEEADSMILNSPSPELIAACRANPEVMAALDSGDAARFARAVGVEPSEAYLAAAPRLMAGFSREAAGYRPSNAATRHPGDAATELSRHQANP